jgi:multiple sugar transport system permease protein/cellobiose transport system permease protein
MADSNMTKSRKSIFPDKKDMIGYSFLLPMLLGVALFVAYPVLEALRISFFHHNGVKGTWAGLYNYSYVLTDNLFHQAFENTLYMGILGIVLGLPLSFILASLVNTASTGKNLFKSLYFIPNITSQVACTIIFLFIFSARPEGLMNALLQGLGLKPERWFADPGLSRICVVIMGLWHSTGYYMLIWIAGLQSIGKELYEAANIDGASGLQKWRYITIPGVKPIFVFNLVMCTIGLFKRFGDVYVIGGPDGAPGGSLASLMIYVYRYGFFSFDFGKAAAASYIVFIIILSLTLMNFLLTREKNA